MSGLMKAICNILFVFIIVTIIIHLFPSLLIIIANLTSLTNEQLSNVIATSDVVLATLVAVYSIIDQKSVAKRCSYEFFIEKDNLSLEGYRRFPSKNENSYTYIYKRNSDDIKEPYYGMSVIMEDNYLCSVGIPLCMKVFTELVGQSILFSNIKVYTKFNEEIIKNEKRVQGILIENTVHNGKKFLIRIQLLCNHQLEKILLDSCIYINFVLTLRDDKGRKNRKYVFLKVQNVMGESNILSISIRNNWISYLLKILKLKYHLYKKS